MGIIKFSEIFHDPALDEIEGITSFSDNPPELTEEELEMIKEMDKMFTV